MTELTEFLFPAPARRSFGSIVRWWESRRLAFNVFVGGAGLVSLSALGLTALLPGDLPTPSDWPSIVLAFGVMANVCYVLGPTVEIALQRQGLTCRANPLPDRADVFGGSRSVPGPVDLDVLGRADRIQSVLERRGTCPPYQSRARYGPLISLGESVKWIRQRPAMVANCHICPSAP